MLKTLVEPGLDKSRLERIRPLVDKTPAGHVARELLAIDSELA